MCNGGVPPSGWVDPRLSLSPCCVEKERSSLSKTRNMLGRASEGLGPGPWGSSTSNPEKEPNSSHGEIGLIGPKAAVYMSCVPLVQHCLIPLLRLIA